MVLLSEVKGQIEDKTVLTQRAAILVTPNQTKKNSFSCEEWKLPCVWNKTVPFVIPVNSYSSCNGSFNFIFFQLHHFFPLSRTCDIRKQTEINNSLG